jgi:hypothetical protein
MPVETLTAAWLTQARACKEQMKRFNATFPDGAVINDQTLAKARGAVLDLTWLAKLSITTPTLLEVLARDTASWVRGEVAKHPTTSVGILDLLAADHDVWVRGEVARNTKTSLGSLQLLSRDANAWVRGEVALNPSTPKSILDVLALDEDDVVKRAYAYRNRPV